MKRLAAVAARLGLSLRQLTALVNDHSESERAPESLMRSFYTARAPWLQTVETICDAMRLPKRVARALLGKLTDRDELELRLEVREEVWRRRGLFATFVVERRGYEREEVSLNGALDDALASAPKERRREALAAFDVAHAGLLHDDEVRELLPAPELSALCRALGFDLRPFMASDNVVDARSLLGIFACDLVCESFPLNPVEAAIIDELPRNHGVAESARLAVRAAVEPIAEEVKDMLTRALGVLAGGAFNERQHDAKLERARIAAAGRNIIDRYLEENPE